LGGRGCCAGRDDAYDYADDDAPEPSSQRPLCIFAVAADEPVRRARALHAARGPGTRESAAAVEEEEAEAEAGRSDVAREEGGAGGETWAPLLLPSTHAAPPTASSRRRAAPNASSSAHALSDLWYGVTRAPAADAWGGKLRIVTLGFGTGAAERVLERRTNPKRSRRACSPRYGLQTVSRGIGGRREKAA
jgi:hypothetical protein